MKLSGEPMKFGINEGAFFFNISIKMLLALLFYITSFVLWTGIVVRNDMSYIVPFSSAIVNVISVVLGVFVFHEYINIYKVVGIAMAVAGLILMNYK